MDGQDARPTFMAFYKRHLPHLQPKNGEFFITYRLAGSLPKEAIKKLQAQRKRVQQLEPEQRDEKRWRIFQKYEELLDDAETGPIWLKDENIAEITQEALHFYDDKRYDLYAYCIMSNHIHLIFKHIDNPKDVKYPITDIMQRIKSYTALKCNRILNRKGAFWQTESYDRMIRDQDELESKIHYTLNNPVKAGLAKHWKDWPHSYCKPEFEEYFM